MVAVFGSAGVVFGVVQLAAARTCPRPTSSPPSARRSRPLVYDARGRVLHEFFKENRSPVPLTPDPAPPDQRHALDRGPQLLPALGRRPVGRRRAPLVNDVLRRCGTARGRQHDHAAARAQPVPHPRAHARPASSRRSRSRSRSSATTRRTRSSRCTSTRSTSARAPTASRPPPRPSSASRCSELTLPECALLAGLPRESAASTRRAARPAAALARRAQGAAQHARDQARSRRSSSTTRIERAARRHAAALQQRPRALLHRDGPPAPRRALRLERGLRGRARVYTTLDMDLQQVAERALEKQLTVARGRTQAQAARARTTRPPAAERPRAQAQTAVPPGRGRRASTRATATIRALVGGRDWNHSNFNRATQAQPPAGLGVQAVRLHRGDRQRIPPDRHHRRRAGVASRRATASSTSPATTTARSAAR